MDVELLNRAWCNEKAAPEILRFDSPLESRTHEQIQLHEETLDDFADSGDWHRRSGGVAVADGEVHDAYLQVRRPPQPPVAAGAPLRQEKLRGDHGEASGVVVVQAPVQLWFGYQAVVVQH